MTEQKCETCLRHGRSCTGGVPEWTCKQIRLQKTNADRIRAMSDEELSIWLAVNDISAVDLKTNVPYEKWLTWLQSPAEGVIENGA